MFVLTVVHVNYNLGGTTWLKKYIMFAAVFFFTSMH